MHLNGILRKMTFFHICHGKERVMANNKYSFVDLFAGCGGLSLGLIKAGLECKWAIEIDENACRTYRYNIGNHIVCDDVRNINTDTVPKADLLVGGFPCQPFSVAGLQGGFDGKDGDLFYQCVRFIHSLHPKVFMLENVAGFATLKKGYYLETALSTLRKLGYFVTWKVLDCSDYSIPQTRKRIIIMGNNLGIKNLYPIPTYKKVSVKQAIDDIWQNPDQFLNNEPMKHSARIVERFSFVEPGETAIDAIKKHPELGEAKITKQCYRRMLADEPAPTIVANFVTTTIHYSQNRNLTAREAARLQSFPDDFVFQGYKTRMSWQKSLSQFEQIGNAVPPKLAELLGECIIKMLDGNSPMISDDEVTACEQLVFDIGGTQPQEVKTPQARGKTHSNRGRDSKYSAIYTRIENLDDDECFVLPDDLGNEFFTFLRGAMRRRSICYEILDDGKNKTFIRRSNTGVLPNNTDDSTSR